MMRENMAYRFTVINDKNEDEGKVNITMEGVDFNLYGRPRKQRELLKREFSSKNFNAKFDAYQKEYNTISKEIHQRGKQLPPVKEIAKLEPYVERLERALPFNAYFTYSTIRDGWVSECMQQGLSREDLTEIKTVLEEVIKEEDPEILTLEEKLRPRKK